MERLGYDSCDSIKIIKDVLDGMKHITTTHFFIFLIISILDLPKIYLVYLKVKLNHFMKVTHIKN